MNWVQLRVHNSAVAIDSRNFYSVRFYIKISTKYTIYYVCILHFWSIFGIMLNLDSRQTIICYDFREITMYVMRNERT